jgi:hypothetical protein
MLSQKRLRSEHESWVVLGLGIGAHKASRNSQGTAKRNSQMSVVTTYSGSLVAVSKADVLEFVSPGKYSTYW